MSVSQACFQNAHHFEVNGGQYMNIANATIVHKGTNVDFVSTNLWKQVVEEAIFDSAARFPPAKCHPGTRKMMIERITDWIHKPDSSQHILWLHGPAGSGKSALAHTICEFLGQNHPQRYGGSFFFARGTTDRGRGVKLFTTLAYQLAVLFPSMRSEINDALCCDPTLPTKSMEIQFSSLISKPLFRRQTPLSHNLIMIIDGLDECADDDGVDTQRNIVTLIAHYIVNFNLPLRFIIASRPEYWIRDAFDTLPLVGITLHLSLRDDVDADKDIKAYLSEEFEKIRLENKRVMGSVVPPWPPIDVIDHLVYEASGQYVYASTVLKFVGKHSKFSDPQEQLRILTSPGPHRASAFSELDRLYATVLSAYPRWETMRRVLAGLLIKANKTIIQFVLGVDHREIVLVLDALSSLIDINQPRALSEDELLLESIFGSMLDGRDKITFCHLSFCEFLEDETRSGRFYVGVDQVRHEIVTAFFSTIHRNLTQNYEVEPHIFLDFDRATYHGIMDDVTFKCILDSRIGALVPLIKHITQRLKLFHPVTSLNYITCLIHDMGRLQSALEALLELGERKPDKHREETEKIDEFRIECKRLQDVVSLVWKRAICALPLCTEFRITPTLVYLTEYHTSIWGSIDELSTVPGISDALSILHQYRHVMRLFYFHENDKWSLELMNFNALFQDGEEPGWRIQGEWINERVFFADQYLHSLLTYADRVDDDDAVSDECYSLEYFFSSRSISHISTKEHLRNACNLSILELMTDLPAWTILLDEHFESIPTSFIVSVLCWFNRELKNPQTRKLLEDLDEALPQKMGETMSHVFEHGFLEYFTRTSNESLCIYGWSDDGRLKSARIRVLPLPQGFHQEESFCSTEEGRHFDYWRTFHDEVFGKTEGRVGEDTTDSVIDPSRWYPYLASELLYSLVKFLFGLIRPKFSRDHHEFEKSIPYLSQCLPYAKPTDENLEAIRAIVYLYPQVTPSWSPPEGLWFLIAEILQKFDHSVLSSEELKLFESWLYSTHIEERYIDWQESV